MAPRRKSSSSRGLGKRPSDANERDGRRKPQFDRGLFSSQSMYERYKSYLFNMIIFPSKDTSGIYIMLKGEGGCHHTNLDLTPFKFVQI